MKQTSLNGTWLYHIGNGTDTPIKVPFSRLPVGRSVCTRYFDASEKAEHLFLKFDGITYYAQIYLNDTYIGEMLPYCEYEFEITDKVQEKDNKLQVILEDIQRAFGPSEGWQNYGGIIRDVMLIQRPAQYIRDVFFKAALNDSCNEAAIETEIDAKCSKDARFRITVSSAEGVLLTYEQAADQTIKTSAAGFRLWSPNTPYLYTLTVELLHENDIIDRYTCQIGFRSITHDRHRFLLNGKPLFLKGVCKHEMVADSGHCPSPAQIETDLRMIKEMGCNYVRLVHYPHCKYTLELADRIGLLVSEEPGLWWSDTANEEIASGSKEVLRRTILRDRNHPCIAFWLCFNECKFTEQYLLDSAAICRKYDPTRMVSGANCMNNEDTLLYYNKCGFDFYTMHPYAQTFDRARTSARILHDKPLLFTEWGGYFLYNNPHLLTDFIKEMHQLYTHPSDDGALAGASFWFFAELEDFNRGEPACIDGVLREGLVERDRKPTLIFDSFCEGMKLFDQVSTESPHSFWFEPAKAFEDLPSYRQLTSSAEISETELLTFMQETSANYGTMRKRVIRRAPVLFDVIPTVLQPGKTIRFEGCSAAKALTVLGLTSAVNGYPLGGAYGETVCTLKVCYEDGSSQTEELKNGVHFTTVYALNGSSRIEPLAESAERFGLFGYDKNFEFYTVNRLDVPLAADKDIRQIELSGCSDRYAPLFYGMYVK